MDGSSVIFIVMLTVMPLLLSTGIAMPYIADSRSKRRTETCIRHTRHDKEAGRYARGS